MWLERDRDRLAAAGPGPANDFREHERVGTVHTVKITDADKRGAKRGGNFFELVEEMQAVVSAG